MQAIEKRKAGQQHQPATENARTDARRGKKGPNTAGCPKPEEEAAATTHPTATSPTTTTGEAHAKRGSGPSNYTQALYRNARCTHAGPKAEKTGPRSLNKGPVQKHALHT